MITTEDNEMKYKAKSTGNNDSKRKDGVPKNTNVSGGIKNQKNNDNQSDNKRDD